MPLNNQVASRDRGQALVLVALASIVLLSFVALAIDGGMAYVQRRSVQNAADGASVAGTFELRQQRRSPTPPSQNEIRRKINAAAEGHGVPDTDGIAGNEVNDNILAFFTDTAGDPVGPLAPDREGPAPAQAGFCEVGHCPPSVVEREAWGVRVLVTMPFKAIFAQVIGFDRFSVGAEATAVTHAGSRAEDNTFWAMFSLDGPGPACEAPPLGAQAEGEIGSANVSITGNVHSNGSFFVDVGSPDGIITGKITYSTIAGCLNCLGKATGGFEEKPIIPIELPKFSRYHDRVWAESSFGTGSNYYGTDLTLGDSAMLGNPFVQPFSYVDGDLIVDGTNVQITGLIYVAGNVIFMPGSSASNRFSIVTPGEVIVSPTAVLLVEPFTMSGDSLLDGDQHNFVFYTILDKAAVGGDPCTEPVVTLGGDGDYVRAGVLAPNGLISVDGNEFIWGSLVGNTVHLSGNVTLQAAPDSFPPQPDRLELLN